MSLNPIFDAALADAPANIWQASSIFPQPVTALLADLGVPRESREAAARTTDLLIGHTDYRDWSFIRGIPVLNTPTIVTGVVA